MSLLIDAYRCLSLLIVPHRCLSLRIVACRCLSLLIVACRCLTLLIFVFRYLSMLIVASPCLLLFILACPCLLVLIVPNASRSIATQVTGSAHRLMESRDGRHIQISIYILERGYQTGSGFNLRLSDDRKRPNPVGMPLEVSLVSLRTSGKGV